MRLNAIFAYDGYLASLVVYWLDQCCRCVTSAAGVLDVDPNKRWTIHDIKQSKWWCEGGEDGSSATAEVSEVSRSASDLAPCFSSLACLASPPELVTIAWFACSCAHRTASGCGFTARAEE